jgi:integrase
MGYAEKRGNYWRGRYKRPDGGYGTVTGESGTTKRFRSKREAEQAANDEEASVRGGKWRDPTAGRMTFSDYVNRWYAAQDLAASTMQIYRHHIEEHLLPHFGDMAVADILPSDIAAWEKQQRAAGYAESSIEGRRKVLHLILADAMDEGLRESNPATRRRGRGRRTGRSWKRAAEKTITTPLGILLTAERAALLSGRDDEFVAVVAMGYTGLRWGELVGLEVAYARPAAVRVEWQLYELDNGKLLRCPPKDESRRTVDIPEWLATLVNDQVVRTQPTPCRCHGYTYVFRGLGAANGAAGRPGPKLVDVARRADLSTGTVSTVMNRPDSVPEATRARVQLAAAELGYVAGGASGQPAAHWRRNGFATWLFQPAVTGWYPGKAPQPPRPVPLLGEPWPGIPVRGRNATGRADACWLPIARGLTPHGLRHTHKTVMEELGIPSKLMDDRMGHEDGSVQARYSHITPAMRRQLLDGLTGLWLAALDARRSLFPGSPVAALNVLLHEPTKDVGG